jgi:dUTP pyrophosphatase
MLKVKRLSAAATLPTRQSPGAAGYDLSSAETVTIVARRHAVVKTDLAVVPPSPDVYVRIAPRSGLAAKNGIDVGAGIIDPDYRGNIGVVLFNHSDTDFKISVGDRIAQMILERIVTPPVVECVNLDQTERGAGGFGSTGVTTTTTNTTTTGVTTTTNTTTTGAAAPSVPTAAPTQIEFSE